MSVRPGRCRRARPDGERGSGSVLLLAVVLVALALLLTVAALVRTQAAASSVRAAADLAALAAASALALPSGVVLAAGVLPDLGAACARAAEVAERNSAQLTACTAGDDGAVRVEVLRATPWGVASASAVAGPSSSRVSRALP